MTERECECERGEGGGGGGGGYRYQVGIQVEGLGKVATAEVVHRSTVHQEILHAPLKRDRGETHYIHQTLLILSLPQ